MIFFAVGVDFHIKEIEIRSFLALSSTVRTLEQRQQVLIRLIDSQ